ncbi:MAG TPA: TlpA disulfide reductase family protein, partial [Ignavibacteriaceae bacterium]|nr:TlpA disulfide reductase family protein [Ignavibacteriaceae bacterium]
MKKHTLFFSIGLILVFFLASCSKENKTKGKFSFEPEKPKPGDSITVLYNPDSTGLKNASAVDIMVYSYSTDLDQTQQIVMQKTADGWSAKFLAPNSAKGVLVKFKNNDDIDNNKKIGYFIKMYDTNGNILPGSYAGYAAAIYSWGSYYLDMERNFDSSSYYFKKEFVKNPDLKYKYLDPFLGVETKLNKDNAASIIIRELSPFQHEAKTQEDFTVLARWYEKAEMPLKAAAYKKILEEKYPNSDYVQNEKFQEFYNESNLNKKLGLLEEFEKIYPQSKYLTDFYDVMAINYLDKKQYLKLKDFFANNVSKPSTYRFYSISTKMLDNNQFPEIALKIARLGVDRARAEINNPTDKKPDYQSAQEWKEDKQNMLGENLYAYSEALFKLGKSKEAEAPSKEAVELTKGKEAAVNQLHADVLAANGEYDAATKEIENYIKNGTATPEMKSLLKDIYVKKNGSSAGFNSYIAQFESVAKQLLVAKLEKQIIKQTAPGFSLTDLDGRKVSLASLKGKTVIIDFWATWCGPCKSSFPGMQKAVELYKDNKDVQFLFINSWENVEDKRENAQDFIQEKNYPFRVLLDLDNK